MSCSALQTGRRTVRASRLCVTFPTPKQGYNPAESCELRHGNAKICDLMFEVLTWALWLAEYVFAQAALGECIMYDDKRPMRIWLLPRPGRAPSAKAVLQKPQVRGTAGTGDLTWIGLHGRRKF